jgi:hypothetical protein
MIKKIISGGQSGADLAGLMAAKEFGFKTSGYISKGFKTLNGPRPQYKDLYNLIETDNSSYKFRTELNVQKSDATIRFAVNFFSAGEICTLNAIKKFNKPYFDVNLLEDYDINKIHEFIESNKVEILNIAGNSENTSVGTFSLTYSILKEYFCFLNRFYDLKRLYDE